MQWLSAVALAAAVGLLSACSNGTGTVTIGGSGNGTTASNIASLTSVFLSEGDATRKQTDNPQITAWNSNVLDYSYVVSSQIETLKITPIAADTSDPPTIRVNGGGLSNAVVATRSASADILLGIDTTTTVTLTVAAADGRNQKIYTLRITRLAASSRNLSKLLLSGGAVLDPAFNPDTETYASTVPFSVSNLSLTPTPLDKAATVKVNGQTIVSGESAPAIPLKVGPSNVFSILVTAADGLTTRTYTLVVTREGSGRLTSLGISCLTGSTCGGLNRPFQPDIADYATAQNYDVSSIKISPGVEDDTATITVNGQSVVSGQPSQAIGLAVGANSAIAIEVTYFTSTNPAAKQLYRVMPTRDAPPAYSQQGYLKPSNPASFQGYGQAVAFSGNTIAVGAFAEGGSGAVYVYTRPSATWSEQAKIKASNAGAGDGFGYSVALSADGNTLAVGAYAEDSAATGIAGDQTDDCSLVGIQFNCAADSGAVYLFTRSGSVWSQQAYIKASNSDAGDGFGTSLALSADGNTLAVGAGGEASNTTVIDGVQANNDAINAGAAYVFTRNGTAWSQQAYIKASNSGAGDGFGTSLALSEDGDTLAVGAANEASNATGIGGDQGNNDALFAGAAYVFSRIGTTWSQQAYIKASNTEPGDQFGGRVALSGDTLAVAATQEDSGANGINGAEGNGNCSLGGGSCGDSGAVYVYTRSGNSWSQQAYIKASNAGADDRLGSSLALSGSLLAVGSYREDSNGTGVGNNSAQANNAARNSGAVYTFTRSDITWSQQTYVKASNAEAGDEFGHGVAVSVDSLAVGALFEDGLITAPAPDSGAVYVFVPFIPPP